MKKIPKQTFINLEKDKKDKIYNAALEEFSKVSFNDASIANIIKNANISRGSFYQYFEDKFDIFKYVLMRIKRETMFFSGNITKNEKKDFFYGLEKMLSYHLELMDNDVYYNFFKNMFLNLNVELEKCLFDVKKHSDKMQTLFVERFDLSNFRHTDSEYIKKVTELIMSISIKCMQQKMILDISNEELMKRYRSYIEIIKEGVMKE